MINPVLTLKSSRAWLAFSIDGSPPPLNARRELAPELHLLTHLAALLWEQVITTPGRVIRSARAPHALAAPPPPEISRGISCTLVRSYCALHDVRIRIALQASQS